MLPDKAQEPDDKFVNLLAAYDQAVASGGQTPLPPGPTPHPIDDRLARAQAVVERLERDRVRRGIPSRPVRLADAPGLSFDDEGRLTQLDRFQIMREIGSGGSGTVYLAYDAENDRQVAVKVPRLEVLAIPNLRYRFLREARTAAEFDHPNLVRVYETGELGPVCYMVSAFVRGPSLRDWVARQDGPVSPEDASAFMAQVADGVGYFHDCGIVHRDLKPANVLLERREKATDAVISDLDLPLANFVPRVSDFGLAKCLELDDGQTRSGTILGTPRYMAPEQAEGRVRAISASSDVFALGVMMYELLTRQTPSWESAETGRVLISPRRHIPRIPPELETICRRCLERDPAQRFSNAREMAAALRSAPPSESNGGWFSRAWRKATKGKD